MVFVAPNLDVFKTEHWFVVTLALLSWVQTLALLAILYAFFVIAVQVKQVFDTCYQSVA